MIRTQNIVCGAFSIILLICIASWSGHREHKWHKLSMNIPVVVIYIPLQLHIGRIPLEFSEWALNWHRYVCSARSFGALSGVSCSISNKKEIRTANLVCKKGNNHNLGTDHSRDRSPALLARASFAQCATPVMPLSFNIAPPRVLPAWLDKGDGGFNGVDPWGCVPSLVKTWEETIGGGNGRKDVNFFRVLKAGVLWTE
jgi:hypothetical protein